MVKYISLLFALLLLFGCSKGSSPDSVVFFGLVIPSNNLSSKSFGEIEGSLDSSDGMIALNIDESEVERKISNYISQDDLRQTLILVLYGSTLDLQKLSIEVLGELAQADSSPTTDNYLPYSRFYRTGSSWILSDERDGSYTYIASCQRTGVRADVDVCTFSSNISGYGVEYSLTGDNIRLANEIEQFIGFKLEEWASH